jgi:hypothetical protein
MNLNTIISLALVGKAKNNKRDTKGFQLVGGKGPFDRGSIFVKVVTFEEIIWDLSIE